jgi:chromosome segregation ATPase
MTDTGPEGLTKLRKLTDLIHPDGIGWAPDKDTILALCDALDAARERIAKWMIENSLATGHGDTVDDLLNEASGQIAEMRDALDEARRKLSDAETYYQMAQDDAAAALKEAQRERDEARSQQNYNADLATTYKHALDEARSDFEKLRHRVYADARQSLTLSSEITGELRNVKDTPNVVRSGDWPYDGR